MPRPFHVPKLCRHKATGQAVARIDGVDEYFGLFGTKAAEEKYTKRMAAWLAAKGQAPVQVVADAAGVTVKQVLAAFLRWAELHYRKDGELVAGQIAVIKSAFRVLARLHPDSLVSLFGRRQLIEVRDEMIRGTCGTSAVAPLMAGFLAAVNGARAKGGRAPLAQANAALWAQAACFLDITAGNNGAYSAAAGPDPCTGMGRALGTLFAALAGMSKTPPPPPPPPAPPAAMTLASDFPAGVFLAVHPGSRGLSELTLSAALAAGTYTLTKE